LEQKESIILERKGAVAVITLNRPGVRNALNLEMIREITAAIREMNNDPAIRLILITSRGDHFCSGADLAWMKDGLEQPEELLKSESMELAGLFRELQGSEAPSICSVKGVVSGGAVGLLAAADFVVAEGTTVLRFPEVKLGLVPATIAPYVLRKAGYGRTSDWMMTGRRIGAREALEAGLIHRICEEGSLDETTALLLEELLSGGRRALQGIKRVLRDLEDLEDPDQVDLYTSGKIAAFRISPEGQEGMRAFLEKRKPGWDEK
jgi:methylglutaconyl-CoA hydratase